MFVDQKIAVVTGIVTNDVKVDEIPCIRATDLRFTKTTITRIENARERLTFDQHALRAPLGQNTEVDSDAQEVKKEVDYSNIKVKSEFSPHKKEIESDSQDVKRDVKDETKINRAALIQQEIALITKEIELGLSSWDDLNSEGDVAESVLVVGSDNVVCGFKDVKSLSSKQISVCNIVSDNDDLFADVSFW
ncbi:60S ribosomal protein L18-2 [Tanacetum coccineum]